MPNAPLHALIGLFRRAVQPAETGALTDAELLARWAAQRDPAAFELLLWRHGPLVLSVCRRMLGHAQDVEDAFQATFLVLVRKAGSIRRGQAFASWLHTVACRVALQARKAAAQREQTGARDLERVLADEEVQPDADVMVLIDEEIGRLPEKYRAPFVLCCLQGRTNEEAARLLGRPIGTILSRLARARQRLRDRLSRRGISPPALMFPFLIPAVGHPLAEATTRAAVLYAASRMTLAAATPPVAALVEGVLQTMFLSKLKTGVAVLFCLALLSAGGFLGLRSDAASEQDRPAPAVRDRDKDREITELRKQLAEARDLVALLQRKLLDLQQERIVPRRGAPATPATPAAPAIAPEDVEILKAKLDASTAELAGSKAMLEEATLRYQRLQRLEQAGRGAVSQEDLGAAKAAVLRYEAEVKVKAAQVRICEVELARAMRLAGKKPAAERTPATTLERRLDALEQRLKEMQQAIAEIRRELKR